MNLIWAALIVGAVTGVAVGCILLVRRNAPEGSYFEDGDRASGVFGVLATGFSVLLGFVVFLAFESYDSSRSGAEAESRIVTQAFETAQFLPAASGRKLSGDLVCYARYVVYQEWPRMASGAEAQTFNPWTVAMFHALKSEEPRSASEQAAYGKWLDQTTDRENARADRTHGAEGVIPLPLWVVLFLLGGVIFVFMMFFADSGERMKVQATLAGGVAIVVSSTLLLLWFLDHPFNHGAGALKPVAMERSLVLLNKEMAIVGGRIVIPCDAQGRPSGG